jgi:beta-N-acetylhexosaminidase
VTMRTKTLRQIVGQMLIVGVEGTQLSPVECAWIKLLQPGGVILFRRNIEAVAETRELLEKVSNISSAAGFRCVDVEGGLVDRLRDVFSPMPSAAAVAATGSRAMWERHGNLIGREIRALGFNTTLAPVLDLALPESAAVMRTRVTSPDPAHVIAYADAFLKGLRSTATVGCGKHFPGLGASTLDSHHVTPAITRTWDELWREDLLPYRKLAKVLPMVMVSHARYPEAGKDQLPASVSKFWIGEILRRKIGYRGLVISDDMEMGGILAHASIEEAAVAAVLAGTDLIEICRDPELILRAFEAMLSESERSPAFRKQLRAASRRLTHAQHKCLPAQSRAPSAKSIGSLREQTRAFAAQVEATNVRGRA